MTAHLFYKKQLAEPLQSFLAEAAYAKFAELNNLALLEITPWGCFRTQDKKTEALLGYTAEELGKMVSFLRLVHPAERDMVTAALRDSSRTQTNRQIEYRIKHKTGAYLWFSSRITLLPNRTDKFLFSLESLPAEQKCLDIKQKIFDDLPAIIWGMSFYDENNNFIREPENFRFNIVNGAVEKILNYPVEVATKLKLTELFPPADIENILLTLKMEFARDKDPELDPNRTIKLVVQHYRQDGTTIALQINLSFVRENKKIIGAFGLSYDITTQLKAQKEKSQLFLALQKSEAIFRNFFDHLPAFGYTHDLQGDFMTMNRMFEHQIHLPTELLKTSNVQDWLMAEHKNAFHGYMKRIIASTTGTDSGYMRVKLGEQKFVVLEYFNQLVRDQNDAPLYVLGAARDVTRRYQKEETNKAIADGSDEGIIFYHKKSLKILFLNVAAAKMLNFEKQELLGQDIRVLFSAESLLLFEESVLKKSFAGINRGKTTVSELEINELELHLNANNGLSINASIRNKEVPFEGEETPVLYITDLTEQKQIQKELVKKTKALEEAIAHDVLTNLYSRNYFYDVLPVKIYSYHKNSDNITNALLRIDINNFKEVNDKLIDHQKADLVLKAFASTTEKTLRKNDYCFRTGGDEFTILLEDVGDQNNCEQVIKKLIENLDSVEIEELGKVRINLSIGIALFNTEELQREIKAIKDNYKEKNNKELDHETAISKYITLLLSRGEEAMYKAKNIATNAIEEYKHFFLESREGQPIFTLKPSKYAFNTTGLTIYPKVD